MHQLFFSHRCLVLCLLLLLVVSCKREPFKPDYTNAKGYVVGRENCKGSDAADYWLVDFTYFPDTPQYGDTLTLNGRLYTNVVKTAGLDTSLKLPGIRVSLDFKTITPAAVISSGCVVPNPTTYALKELFIINQFEIR